MIKFPALAAATIALTAMTSAPASANDISFGLFLGAPGPVITYHDNHFRSAQPRRNHFVPARFVMRDVRSQGCYNISDIRQRDDRYIVKASCGRRGVPVRFVYDARSGQLLKSDRIADRGHDNRWQDGRGHDSRGHGSRW